MQFYFDCVVPDRGAAKINMKVSVGVGSTDQAVLLHFRLRYLIGQCGYLSCLWFGTTRPVRPHVVWCPADVVDYFWRGYVLRQTCLGDLKTDQVIDFLSRPRFKIAVQFAYAHGKCFLPLHVDHVYFIGATLQIKLDKSLKFNRFYNYVCCPFLPTIVSIWVRLIWFLSGILNWSSFLSSMRIGRVNPFFSKYSTVSSLPLLSLQIILFSSALFIELIFLN